MLGTCAPHEDASLPSTGGSQQSLPPPARPLCAANPRAMAQPSARWLGGWPTWVAACTLLLLAAAPWATTALQDGQALTPPMGYNT